MTVSDQDSEFETISKGRMLHHTSLSSRRDFNLQSRHALHRLINIDYLQTERSICSEREKCCSQSPSDIYKLLIPSEFQTSLTHVVVNISQA